MNLFITKATKADLPAIQDLMSKYDNKCKIEAYHLNNKDLNRQVRTEDGTLVGFAWIGLMAGKKVAYADKLVVHPDFHHRGIPGMMFKELITEGLRLGVEEMFGIIRQDEYHDASAVSTLKVAVGADLLPYTYVRASLKHMAKELGIGV